MTRELEIPVSYEVNREGFDCTDAKIVLPAPAAKSKL